jgi:hypothetical protein
MADEPVQILEVRGDDPHRPTTATIAVTGKAARAIQIALSEELDRRRASPMTSADETLELREHAEFVERFTPLSSGEDRAVAVLPLTEDELRSCLLGLSDYRARVDGEHYQPLELRERLALTAEIEAILWEANAAVAQITAQRLSGAER